MNTRWFRWLQLHSMCIIRQRRFSKWLVVAVIISCFLAILSSRAISQQPEVLELKEVRKFIFMKNHKCASSTVENIIFRFALKNELNLVLPEKGNYLSTTELFDRASLSATKWRDLNFDIFSLHNRWNKKEVVELLREEVPTFTIIREPVEVFESMFHYLDPQLREFYGVQDIHDMVCIIQNTTLSDAVQKRLMGFVGRNQMAWDLGLSPDIFDNETAIKKEIERLDHEFHLVMVANRMEESLILLKQLLNWPLQNVIHLKLNRRKPEKSSRLSAAEKKVLEEWLAADVQIFQYFSHRFDEKIEQFNWKNSRFLAGFSNVHSAMKRQTQLLEAANRKLYHRCVFSEVGNEKLTGKFKDSNNNIIGYIINEDEDDCALYATSEDTYLSIFRNQLLSRITKPSLV
ncbi:hypothetical protein OUZ56_019524 [Daphnia magna]|uniref:Galactose-3-o-sulfotransferase n=1 Tax=Daphnia magna TaxID=35525 RepID=A0ABQ9ZBU8_9CRUS|nr:hypothetical protein OUZ56_019524 [Daphnia magna]